MTRYKYFVGIDPRLSSPTKSQGTGWGILYSLDDSLKLTDSGIIHLATKDGNNRYQTLAHSIRGILSKFPPKKTLCLLEFPVYQGSFAKGLNKLMFAAGVLLGSVISLDVSYSLVTPSTWKKKGDELMLKDDMELLFPHKKDNWIGEDEWVACSLAYWGYCRQGQYEVCQVD